MNQLKRFLQMRREGYRAASKDPWFRDYLARAIEENARTEMRVLRRILLILAIFLSVIWALTHWGK